jgi:hypothetical protein
MNKKYRNMIFIIVVILFLILIYLFNAHEDIYDIKYSHKYEIFQDENRKFLYIKLKASKKQKYERIAFGASTTHSMLFAEKYKIPLIVLYGLSYKELYEIIQAYFYIHPETKECLLPLEYHSILQVGDDFNINKFDFNKNLSISELVNVYYSVDITRKNFFKLLKSIQNNLSINKNEDLNENICFERISYRKLYPRQELSLEKEKENIKYISNIIDFLKNKGIKIICFVAPYNYIYMQDMMNDYNLRIIENFEKVIVDKGINIIDFSIKNPNNETYMNKTYLYADLMHPNFIYGKIILDSLYNKNEIESDKFPFYRISTSKNLHNNMEKLKEEIKQYKKNNKEYIKEYNTWKPEGNKIENIYWKDIPEKYVKDLR